MTYFRHYLLGRKFLVRTDHQALRWLQHFKDPEGQVARWQKELQCFDYECVHRPGAQHSNADALSHLHEGCPATADADFLISIVALCGIDHSLWAEDQRSDCHIKLLYDRLSTHENRPSKAEMMGHSWEALCLWSAWSHLSIEDDVLYFSHGPNYGKRIVVPKARITSLLTQLHDELGHAGQKKMEQAVLSRFWWPNQRRDIADFCNACSVCLQVKVPIRYHRAPLQPMVSGYPNQLVGMDIIGPLPLSNAGNQFILVLVDYFTKWVEAIPIPEADALSTADALIDHWVTRGAPEQLHADRGSNFESAVVEELCRLLCIQRSRTTAYHPPGKWTSRTHEVVYQ